MFFPLRKVRYENFVMDESSSFGLFANAAHGDLAEHRTRGGAAPHGRSRRDTRRARPRTRGPARGRRGGSGRGRDRIRGSQRRPSRRSPPRRASRGRSRWWSRREGNGARDSRKRNIDRIPRRKEKLTKNFVTKNFVSYGAAAAPSGRSRRVTRRAKPPFHPFARTERRK